MKKHNPGFGSLSLLLAGLVAVIALSLGCVFLFTTIWAEDFPNNRQLAGALFIAFGCYRGYMGWRRYRLQQQNEDNDD